MLAIQEYLQTHSLEELKEEFAIKVTPDLNYPNLLLFKYSQIDSRPENHPIVVESRGLILNQSNNWSVVCYGLNRFFNFGQGCAAQFHWNTATTYIKLDGSCMNLFWNPYSESWQVATTGHPNAAGNVGAFGFTFKDLFWKTWEQLGYELPKDKNKTYVFELTSPYNKIVVSYPHSELNLLAVRDLTTFKEEDPQQIAYWNNWLVCPKFPNFNSFEEVVNHANENSGVNLEGYIVVDQHFNRVKIKGSAYVALHHLKGSFSMANFIEVLRSNEGSEVLLHFPEYSSLYQELKARLNTLIIQIENIWDQTNHIQVQKDFAIAIKDFPFKDVLFALRANKISSIKEGIQTMRVEYLMRLLNTNDFEGFIF